MAAAKQRPEQQPATCDPTVAVRTAAAPNLAAEADHNTDGPRARGGAPLWWSLERPRQLLGTLACRRRVISKPTLTTAPHAALSGVSVGSRPGGWSRHMQEDRAALFRGLTRGSRTSFDPDENSFPPPFPPLHVHGILEPFSSNSQIGSWLGEALARASSSISSDVFRTGMSDEPLATQRQRRRRQQEPQPGDEEACCDESTTAASARASAEDENTPPVSAGSKAANRRQRRQRRNKQEPEPNKEEVELPGRRMNARAAAGGVSECKRLLKPPGSI